MAMAEVVIAGIGQTPVGEHWEIGLRDLALGAMQEALRDSDGLRPQALFVGNMLSAQSFQSGSPRRSIGRLCRPGRD